MNIDLKKGDTILGGKFRNKPYEVKDFGTDDKGQPTIITTSGKTIKLLTIRIKKLMKQKNENTRPKKLMDLLTESSIDDPSSPNYKPPYKWERKHIAEFRRLVPKVKQTIDRMGQINRMEASDYEPFLKTLEELVKVVKAAKRP